MVRRQTVVALVSGILFGVGLAVSGMLDPVRVRGFLDLFGRWDPTLAFVMGGAILPMVAAWLIRQRMVVPLGAARFHLPDTNRITAKLVGGAALFGIGWGLAGLCPGPGVASLFLHPREAGLFVAMMFVGFAIVALVQRRQREGER